jgi:Xaa-Pro aminopeptidase
LSAAHFSASEFRRRYSTVRSSMEKKGLGALVIYGNSGNLMRNEANVYYVSDYMDRHHSYVIFPLDGEPVLFIGLYNHLQNAREVSVIRDTRWGGENPAKLVAEELKKCGLDGKKVGIWAVGGAKGFVPHDHYSVMVGGLPRTWIFDVTKEFNSLRLVKSPEELRVLERAAKYTDDGVAELAKRVKPGMKEFELGLLVERGYVGEGGQTYLHYICSTPMGKPQKCVPWQRPANRTIRKGDVILTEISAACGGYSGQIHRPIAVGAEPSKLFRELYDTALEAYEGVAKMMKAGADAVTAVQGASVIRERGFEICDSLAHGFGVDLLPPHLGIEGSPYWPSSSLELKEDMVVVIQPNPITPNQKAGVQLGNLCVIQKNGSRSLQRYPMEFVIAG